MDEQPITNARKSFLRNDRMLVCSMLVFYGLCFIGLTGTAFWWLNQRSQTVSSGATSTAVAIATQQVNATVTAIAHTTELAQFEFIDHFDDTSGHWYVGTPPKNSRWDGSLQIKDGVYTWNVNKVKEPFVYQTDFFHEIPVKDFDTYLDAKFTEEISGDVCSGLVFRKSFKGWNHGAYVFIICNDSTFSIAYFGENGWDNILGRRFSDTILPSDWNRIEINALGSHFNFSINNVAVYELTDDRQVDGALGIIRLYRK